MFSNFKCKHKVHSTTLKIFRIFWCFLPLSWFHLPTITTFDVRNRFPWGNLGFRRVLGAEGEPATEQQISANSLQDKPCWDCSPPPANKSLGLLFLRLSGFHADSADFQNWFGRIRVPGPEGLLPVLPDRAPRLGLSLPGQTNFQQVPDIVFGEHQEGVGQVQPNDAFVAAERRSGKI